jgi:uncharacterized protein
MRRFEAAGFPYGVRITVTHSQISRLPESINFVCSGFSPTKIQVEPAYRMGRWAGAPSAETAEFIEAYRKAQTVAGDCRRKIYFSAARLGLLTNHFCGISQDNFNLTPDGNVSACYEAFSEEQPRKNTFFYGQPDQGREGYTFDFQILNRLRSQGVENRKFCRGCFAKWSCAGDCYYKSLIVNGTGGFAGTDRCRIIRELTKDQILEKIVQSGGLFWREGSGMGVDAEHTGKE